MDGEKTVTSGPDLAQHAAMETTSRLIAALVNEGLAYVTTEDPKPPGNVFSFTLVCPRGQDRSSVCMKIHLREGTSYSLLLPTKPEEYTVLMPPLEPADIVFPVLIQDMADSNAPQQLEHRPEKVFDVVAPWICAGQDIARNLRGELENSADNQGMITSSKLPSILSNVSIHRAVVKI